MKGTHEFDCSYFADSVLNFKAAGQVVCKEPTIVQGDDKSKTRGLWGPTNGFYIWTRPVDSDNVYAELPLNWLFMDAICLPSKSS